MGDGNDRPGGPAKVRTLEAELELASEFARRLEKASAGVVSAFLADREYIRTHHGWSLIEVVSEEGVHV